MPSLTVTAVDINHAVRRAIELGTAIKKAQANKRLTINEVRLILQCAPNPEGRPKNEDVYETMSIASQKTAIPISQLKAIKRMGCPAFVGSRIHGPELREWLETNQVDQMSLLSPLDLEKLKGMQVVRKRHQFSLDVKRGEYLLADDVRRVVRLNMTTARSVMAGKATGLAMILSALTGADAVSIEEKIKAMHKEVIAEMNVMKMADVVVKCECGKETKL